MSDLKRDVERLAGLRILVVEDVFLLADELEDLLEAIGCRVVGPVADVRGGLQAADRPLDGALLDVNLSNGEDSFPVAAALAAHHVPFIFLTGYDAPAAIPDSFGATPRLHKPVELLSLVQAMAAAFA